MKKKLALPTSIIITLVVFSLAWTGCMTHRENSPLPPMTQAITLTPTPSVTENLLDQEIVIMGQEGIQVCVTDPLGRRLGIDTSTGTTINEIPKSEFEDNPDWGYEATKGDTSAEPTKMVTARIVQPIDGIYTIEAYSQMNTQGGGVALSAWHNGEVKAMRLAYIDFDQTLPVKYQFTFSSDNEELVTELVIIED